MRTLNQYVKLDVLAIMAHPDDAEITCGGLLIKFASNMREVGVIDLSNGEMGSLGTQKDRSQEALKAAHALGLSYRGNLNLPDAAIVHNHENAYRLAEQIRYLRPKLVILPHWQQRHPDHTAVSKIGYDACFFAGLKKLPIKGEPHRPEKIIYASYSKANDYSFLVDISAYINLKEKAIACYQSQFGDLETYKDLFDLNGQNIYESLRIRAAYLGSRVGIEFAEAYSIQEDILIDDPFLMPVKSL